MSQSFDALREQLLRTGIAPRHVRRYLRELGEHLSDLTAKEIAAGYDVADAALRARAALGYDDELAKAMIMRREFRSLTTRAPWLVFGLAPPFFILACFIAAVFILISSSYLILGPYPHVSLLPVWYRSFVAAFFSLVNFMIGPLAALLFIKLALRQRMSSVWPLIGLLPIVLFGAFLTLSTYIPSVDGDKSGYVAIGFLTYLPPTRDASLPMLTLRALATLVPATWLYLMSRTRVRVDKT